MSDPYKTNYFDLPSGKVDMFLGPLTVDAAHMAVEEWSKSAIAPDTLDEDRSAFIGRVDMLRNWLADRA